MSEDAKTTEPDKGNDYLQDLSAIEAEATADEASEGEFLGAEQKPETEQPSVTTGEILAPILKITFGLLARRKGEHWALSDSEAQELGDAYGGVVDKYFPDIQTGPEVTAIMCTLIVVGPRIAEDKRQAEEKRREKAEQEAAGGGVDAGQD